MIVIAVGENTYQETLLSSKKSGKEGDQEEEDEDDEEAAEASDAAELDLDSLAGVAPPPLPEDEDEVLELVAVEDVPEGPPQQVQEVSSSDEEVGKPPCRGKFVVSLTTKGSRTLHRIGECYRTPGVHYYNYEMLGDSRPAAATYHRTCKDCFQQGLPAEDADSGESEGSSSSQAVGSDSSAG